MNLKSTFGDGVRAVEQALDIMKEFSVNDHALSAAQLLQPRRGFRFLQGQERQASLQRDKTLGLTQGCAL